MKAYLFIIVFSVLCLFSTAQAQELRYGIRGGVNFATWSGDAVNLVNDVFEVTSLLETESRTAFHFGGFVNIEVIEPLSLETGLFISQKGFSARLRISEETPRGVQILGPSLKTLAKSTYIDIPVIARIKPFGGFSVYAGPQFSFLLQNTLETKAGLFGISLINNEQDIKDQFAPLDVAIVAGVGYEFENGINFNAGYDFGLTSLDERERIDVNNRVFKLSVGYTF